LHYGTFIKRFKNAELDFTKENKTANTLICAKGQKFLTVKLRKVLPGRKGSPCVVFIDIMANYSNLY